MGDMNGSLYSARVGSGRTSYFLDVRRAVNGRFYLTLTESRRTSDDGFDQNRIFLFEEGAAPFREALDAAFSALEQAAAARGEPPTGSGSTGPGRNGRRWMPEEDEKLEGAFRTGEALEDIARKLDRSRKAVWLRLERLGLIPAGTTAPAAGGAATG